VTTRLALQSVTSTAKEKERAATHEDKSKRVFNALETFRIEMPSWGIANTGTRFGRFIQPPAATSTEKDFSAQAATSQFCGTTLTLQTRKKEALKPA